MLWGGFASCNFLVGFLVFDGVALDFGEGCDDAMMLLPATRDPPADQVWGRLVPSPAERARGRHLALLPRASPAFASLYERDWVHHHPRFKPGAGCNHVPSKEMGCTRGGDSLEYGVYGILDLVSVLGYSKNVAGEDGSDHCVDCGFEVGVGSDFSAFDASLEHC